MTSDEEGRVGSRRGLGVGGDGHRDRWDRQARKTTKARLVGQAVTYGARFVAVPLGLRLVGPERYGLWLASGSLLGWFGLAHGGLGGGLVNALSEATGRCDDTAMRRHVSTAVFAFTSIALPLGIALVLFAQSSWIISVFGVASRPDLHEDARVLTTVAVGAFALTVALSFVGAMCLGLQEGYLPVLAAAVGDLMVVLGLGVLWRTGASAGGFALVSALPPVLATGGLAGYLFWSRHRSLRPSVSYVSADSLRKLLGFGLPLWLGQVGEIAVLQSANLLIANRLGPQEVPRYAVPYSLFAAVTQLCHAVYFPYWPAWTEAGVRGEWAWFRRKALSVLKVNTAISVLCGAAVLACGRWFIGWWAGPAAVPEQTLLGLMALYSLVLAVGSVATTLMWALRQVMQQSALSLAAGICQIAGFWLLSPRLGLAAIPTAGAVGLTVAAIVSWSLVARELGQKQASVEPGGGPEGSRMAP